MSCVDLAYISNEECIGNSLSSINGNFAALSAAVCDLSGGPSSSDLLTLINTLSTNMQNIGNYPYLEYAWVTAPNAAAQSVNANTLTVLTLTTEVADTGNFGSISSNQITLSAGTYQYDAEAFYSAYNGTENEGMLGLWNNSTSQFISRVGHSDLGSGGHYHLKGQFTISTQSILTLRMISNIALYVKPGIYYNTIQSTGTNPDYSQRTTIKLWKVG